MIDHKTQVPEPKNQADRLDTSSATTVQSLQRRWFVSHSSRLWEGPSSPVEITA